MQVKGFGVGLAGGRPEMEPALAGTGYGFLGGDEMNVRWEPRGVRFWGHAGGSAKGVPRAGSNQH